MDELFAKLDDQVEATLKTLFPPADKALSARDAQHRAQGFSDKVSMVSRQLAELKGKMDEMPDVDSSPQAALRREIDELRRDIQLKDEVLDKHRQTLSECVERLQRIDRENRALIDGASSASE
ncbi:hypothetical protein H4R26_001305 [Coemansia thaxteri]|uniref:Mediator of RNA polymerase II transcription subunit 9 n=1 Tax=Coemansia thaxteri TaxID=2663907 RepID=A0A9W8BH10_9FUNG|nr:hypothetical protein H4R26_001305 [Coemansia thaxteri]